MIKKSKKTTTPLVVKKSRIPGAGRGLFANQDFRKGEFLGEYKGKFLSDEECEKLPHDSHMLDITDLKLKNITTLLPSKRLKLGFINHAPAYLDGKKVPPSKTYNVEFFDQRKPPYVRIRAVKPIKKGEEIYLNYGRNIAGVFMKDPKIREFYKTP